VAAVNLSDIVEGLPPTKLSYQDDPYLFEAGGTLLRASREQGDSYYVVLSETIFHPKDGGQPSDVGSVVGPGYVFRVKKAMKAQGHVVLYGKSEGRPAQGSCLQKVDGEKRRLYMRRHTAAHLLDGVLEEVTGRSLEPTDSWLGEPCYVSYMGERPSEETVKAAERRANAVIAGGRKVETYVVKPSELKELRQFWRPALEGLSEVRLVRIAGYEPIPCGGTHVKDLVEVVGVSLRAVQDLGGAFRLHFDVL
jgi:alanyl-tRNA synthetase